MSPSEADATDAAAVAACVSGDCDALEALYAQHARECLALARSVLVDTHHAEDAVQEAFLELWRHPDRFDPARSTGRRWLLMLTHRKAVDRVRVEQRRQTMPLEDQHDRAEDRAGPEAAALVAMLGEQAREALAGLSEVKREALVLAYWGGYTQAEVAAITGAPVGTVKTRMRNGMIDLRPAVVALR